MKWLPYILLLFATFFWGATFIFVKATVQLIPVNYFLFLRFGLATLMGLPLILFSDDKLNGKVWKKGVLLGVFLFSSYLFQTIGLLYTTPARAAFVTGLSVVFVPVIAYLLYRRSIEVRERIGVLLSVAGTALLTINFVDTSQLVNIGDAIILLTAISIAFHILYAENLEEGGLFAILWIQFLTMTALALLLIPFEATPEVTWYRSDVIVVTLVLTVILATIYAFAAQFYAQSSGIKPTHVGIIFATEPVFALVIDIMVGIYPAVQAMVGMGLILLAILLITTGTDPDQKADQGIRDN